MRYCYFTMLLLEMTRNGRARFPSPAFPPFFIATAIPFEHPVRTNLAFRNFAIPEQSRHLHPQRAGRERLLQERGAVLQRSAIQQSIARIARYEQYPQARP